LGQNQWCTVPSSHPNAHWDEHLQKKIDINNGGKPYEDTQSIPKGIVVEKVPIDAYRLGFCVGPTDCKRSLYKIKKIAVSRGSD